MSSVPAVATCRESAGPPCDQLLLDPEAVLADRNRWPHHLCAGVIRESTVTWGVDRALDLLGPDHPPEIDDWTRASPLPVGPHSMPGALDRLFPSLTARFDLVTGLSFGSVSPGLRHMYQQLAAVPWGGRAAFILQPDMPFVDVVAFGIVDDRPIHGDLPWLPATMQFTTAGWQSERVQSFCTNADRWWTWYGGKIQAHRPRGSYQWTLSRIEHALLRYVTETGDIPPGKERFIVWGTSIGGEPRTAPSPKILQRRLVEGGITDWTTWSESVLKRSQGLS